MSLIARSDDCLVTYSDLETLKCSHCVNDTIIHFFCNTLNNSLNISAKKIFFVNPSVTQLIQISSVEFTKEILRENQRASNSTYLFFPLSNLQPDEKGHWSLLLFFRSKRKNIFLHFDSLKKRNTFHAKSLAQKISEIFNIKHYEFSNMKTPSQSNGYDCGIYLMAIMNEISMKMSISKELLTKISPDYVQKFRICLSQYILNSNQLDTEWIEYYKLM